MSIDDFFGLSRTTEPFTAKYAGRCALDTCEKPGGAIEPGDAVRFVDGELVHQRCGARIARGQADPYCDTCFCYHVGDCA